MEGSAGTIIAAKIPSTAMTTKSSTNEKALWRIPPRHVEISVMGWSFMKEKDSKHLMELDRTIKFGGNNEFQV